MEDIKDRAREYLAKHSEYSEVFGQIFVAVDTLTAMVDLAKRETKELEAQIDKMKCCGNCSKNGHICVAEEMQGKLCGKNKDKWELRRKKKMTKEELKQKAYEYAIKEIPFIECITQNDLEILVQQAYITGAEPREKRIEELEAQIEKMKCCENCKHSDTECEGHIVCNKGHFFDCLSNKIFDHTTEEKDYWEIKESE